MRVGNIMIRNSREEVINNREEVIDNREEVIDNREEIAVIKEVEGKTKVNYKLEVTLMIKGRNQDLTSRQALQNRFFMPLYFCPLSR